MKARHPIIVFLLLLAPFGGNAQEAGGKRVLISEDKLSVHVTNAPLFDVLKEIGAETGMGVKVDPEVNKDVTCAFENVPMDKGIARLIHPLDFVIKWKRIRDGGKYSENITSVEIFREGERAKAQQVLSPPRSPEDIHREIEEFERTEKENITQRKTTRPRPKKPAGAFRSSVTKVDEGEMKDNEGAYSTTSSTGTVRIRKFEIAKETDSYDELSP